MNSYQKGDWCEEWVFTQLVSQLAPVMLYNISDTSVVFLQNHLATTDPKPMSTLLQH